MWYFFCSTGFGMNFVETLPDDSYVRRRNVMTMCSSSSDFDGSQSDVARHRQVAGHAHATSVGTFISQDWVRGYSLFLGG